MLKLKQSKESVSQVFVPDEVIQMGITCGTAAGAKRGRVKGNHQKA